MAQAGHKKTDSVDGAESVAIAAVNRSLEINIGDRLADRAFIDDGFLLDQPGHQGGGAELIDAARHALGVFEDALDRVVGEERPGGVTRDADLMFDVAQGLLQIERAEVKAHGEALGEGLVHGQMQGVRSANPDGRPRPAWPTTGCPRAACR